MAMCRCGYEDILLLIGSAGQHASIIKCFEDENRQTPKRYQAIVDHARTGTKSVQDDIGDVDARFARDMQMAMNLSLAPIDLEQ